MSEWEIQGWRRRGSGACGTGSDFPPGGKARLRPGARSPACKNHHRRGGLRRDRPPDGLVVALRGLATPVLPPENRNRLAPAMPTIPTFHQCFTFNEMEKHF